ncbi:MAG: ABC transporter ATP-binding protein, partial [Bacteroidia bacterium]|nr:ABC transporter ATP-binding protein [Bacteroidia bacterium]
MIRTLDLSIGYHQGKTVRAVQQGLNLQANTGELIALIGPNGCGKSTLLRTLAGLQEPLGGTIQLAVAGKEGLDNRQQSEDSSENRTNGSTPIFYDLKALKLTERAKCISLVLTDSIQLGYVTVEQLVAMGRHPYTSLSGKRNKSDEKHIQEALKAVHLEAFSNRLVWELSDGERQRVMIAKALAQNTPIILLDEPTSFLDLPNRVEILLLLRTLAREMRKCILISTHEIDLAIRLADKLWLMNAGETLKTGIPAELIANGSIQSVFQGDSFGFDPETGHVIIF